MLHKSMGFRMFVLFLENLIFTAECSMVTGTLPKRIGKFEEDMYKEPQTVYKIWGDKGNSETYRGSKAEGIRKTVQKCQLPRAALNPGICGIACVNWQHHACNRAGCTFITQEKYGSQKFFPFHKPPHRRAC